MVFVRVKLVRLFSMKIKKKDKVGKKSKGDKGDIKRGKKKVRKVVKRKNTGKGFYEDCRDKKNVKAKEEFGCVLKVPDKLFRKKIDLFMIGRFFVDSRFHEQDPIYEKKKSIFRS